MHSRDRGTLAHISSGDRQRICTTTVEDEPAAVEIALFSTNSITKFATVALTGDPNSKTAQHANQFGHSIDFDQATIVDKAREYHKRLFLEAWHSLRDRNAGNEHIDVPEIYSSPT